MLKIQKNYSLKNDNSFKLDIKADYFVKINNVDELRELSNNKELINLKRLVIGEGSNVLFRSDYHGLVIKNKIFGKKILFEDNQEIILKIGAGENWHDLVTWTVSNNWGGIENLALIPGTVGAAPVQNIAAYGQNFSDIFISLDAYDFELGKVTSFTKTGCQFGYRDSIFKKRGKNNLVVVSVQIKLKKNYQLETDYFMLGLSNDSLKCELEQIARSPFTVKDVYQAVVNIRRRKLPDVDQIPSVGSFFLNPVINKQKLKQLQKQVTNLQYYPIDQLTYKQLNDPSFKKEDYVKVAAGRLLDELGWRGKKIGNVSIYDKHALVIVHNGKASGQEIYNFAQKVKNDVYEHYGIKLETEVNII